MKRGEEPRREKSKVQERRAQRQKSQREATGPLVSGYWEDLQAPSKEVSGSNPATRHWGLTSTPQCPQVHFIDEKTEAPGEVA